MQTFVECAYRPSDSLIGIVTRDINCPRCEIQTKPLNAIPFSATAIKVKRNLAGSDSKNIFAGISALLIHKSSSSIGLDGFGFGLASRLCENDLG